MRSQRRTLSRGKKPNKHEHSDRGVQPDKTAGHVVWSGRQQSSPATQQESRGNPSRLIGLSVHSIGHGARARRRMRSASSASPETLRNGRFLSRYQHCCDGVGRHFHFSHFTKKPEWEQARDIGALILLSKWGRFLVILLAKDIGRQSRWDMDAK